MNEQIVNFEVAKLAKEEGFDWKCSKYYDSPFTSEIKFRYILDNSIVGLQKVRLKRGNKNSGNLCLAPTQSLLQKWLREKFNKHIVIFPKLLPDNSTAYYIYKSKNQSIDFKDLYNTYEEALEDALYKLLKEIENEINK